MTMISRRRDMLRTLAVAPVALSLPHVARAVDFKRSACVLSPAMTEGPFFVDERLNRSNLVGNDAGPGLRDALPLSLAISVVDATQDCKPLAGVQVDVWHTDALGRYSDVQDQRGRTFCRGFQISDRQGRVTFDTVY